MSACRLDAAASNSVRLGDEVRDLGLRCEIGDEVSLLKEKNINGRSQ